MKSQSLYVNKQDMLQTRNKDNNNNNKIATKKTAYKHRMKNFNNETLTESYQEVTVGIHN